jgi:hypothetical protein
MKIKSMPNTRNDPILLVIIFFTVFSGLLSGCHPCALPGVCDELSKNVTTIMNDKGEIYFDIPARKNYKRAELWFIEVYGVKDGEATGDVWGIEENPEQLGVAPDLPLPLRYGQILPKAKVYVQPQALKNGLYGIRGSVILYDEHGSTNPYLSGHFRYDKGIVQNLND